MLEARIEKTIADVEALAEEARDCEDELVEDHEIEGFALDPRLETAVRALEKAKDAVEAARQEWGFETKRLEVMLP
jgi:hypothetical protein